MELGGKDAAIVLNDAHGLPSVASILLRGVFQSAGQNCVGIERVIAEEGAYKRLLALVEPRIKALRVGSALDNSNVDVGAMISSAPFDRLESLISEAVAQGARLLAGGKRYSDPSSPSGSFFTPTLLADVTPSMRIAQEELFAPIFLLMRASSPADAVAIANGTAYGLGASIFGSNRSVLNKCVDDLQAGMVSVNDFAVYYAVQLPFGGVKGSGYGRFAGEEGLRSLCNLKSVCVDRWPGVSTSIPPAVDYPIKNAKRAWEFCRGIIELGYGIGLGQRGEGVWRLAKNA